MNEEQSKRLADAAEAVISAADALEEARAALDDAKFNSEQERERTQAIQHATNRLDSARRKLEDALRKGAVASVAAGRQGMFARYQGAGGGGPRSAHNGEERGRPGWHAGEADDGAGGARPARERPEHVGGAGLRGFVAHHACDRVSARLYATAHGSA